MDRVDFDGRKATAGRHDELDQSRVVVSGRHHKAIDQYLRIAEVISGQRDEIAAHAGQQIHGKHRSDEGLPEAIASPSFVTQAIQIAVDTGTIAEPRLLAGSERPTGSVELGIEVQGVIAFSEGAADAVVIDVADGEDIATGAKGSGFRVGIVGEVIPPARGHHLSGDIVRNGPRCLRRIIVRGQIEIVLDAGAQAAAVIGGGRGHIVAGGRIRAALRGRIACRPPNVVEEAEPQSPGVVDGLAVADLRGHEGSGMPSRIGGFVEMGIAGTGLIGRGRIHLDRTIAG